MLRLCHFLSLTLLVTLLCVQGELALFAQPLKDRNGKSLSVGLQLYSVRADCAKDLPGVLKAVSHMGYTGVEFAGYYGRSSEELHRMLLENHLQCYGTHVDMNALQGDNLDKTIAFCKGLGCAFVVVPWLPVERRNSKQAIVETAHFFNTIATKLAREGIILGWHNEDYEFQPVEGETIWDTFCANTDKAVALQFDTGNALAAGMQAAPFLRKYPKRVVSVHVKDHSTTNPNALLGEGDEHWQEVIPLLKHKIAARWFIIEQESYSAPPLVCVEKCLRNFEKLWNTYK